MSTETDNILNLIAATIFADQRVYNSEIQVFVNATAELKILQTVKPRLTENRILAWYETNKGRIFEKVKMPYFKDWFYSLLDQLSDVEDEEQIIDIMQKISRADGSVHVSERALFTLAKRYWGMR